MTTQLHANDQTTKSLAVDAVLTSLGFSLDGGQARYGTDGCLLGYTPPCGPGIASSDCNLPPALISGRLTFCRPHCSQETGGGGFLNLEYEMHLNQITMIGGPLDGTCHELHGGLLPDSIAFSPDGIERHWYRVADDEKTAIFERTEVLNGPAK